MLQASGRGLKKVMIERDPKRDEAKQQIEPECLHAEDQLAWVDNPVFCETLRLCFRLDRREKLSPVE